MNIKALLVTIIIILYFVIAFVLGIIFHPLWFIGGVVGPIILIAIPISICGIYSTIADILESKESK